MPGKAPSKAVSKAQQRAAAIAKHEPQKLHAANRNMLSMPAADLEAKAATKRKGLPARVKK